MGVFEGKKGRETGPRAASPSRASALCTSAFQKKKGVREGQKHFFFGQDENNSSILWRLWNCFVILQKKLKLSYYEDKIIFFISAPRAHEHDRN